MITLIAFIGLFIAVTGVYAIITALNQMGKMKSDSSLETKFFKFNAPVGFTYGIVALGLVFGLIKYHDLGSQENLIKSLTSSVDSLKSINGQLQLNGTNPIAQITNETFSYLEPKSIFGGKVLVEAESGGIIDEPSLKFTGIIGVGTDKNGPFTNMTIETDKGKRFFFMTTDSSVWGVNTINSVGGLTVEIYREN